jgi:O-antigen/teichoic acid export membrane protein
MSIERQAISGLKWTASSKFVTQAFAWVVTLVVVRLLSPADYGLMAMATVVISISSAIAELGLDAAIVRARSLTPEELAKLAGFVMALNVGIGLLLMLAAPLVAWAFREPRLVHLTQALSLQFVLSALSAVPQALMARDMRFQQRAWIDLASGLTSSATTLAGALLGYGVWALALGTLAGAAARTTLLLVFGQSIRPSLRLTGIREHLRYGGAMTTMRLLSDLTLQSDVLIASRFLPAAAIGAYSVAVHLATLPMQKIMSVVNQVAFPTAARLQDDVARLREGLIASFRVASLVSVPLLWGLCACAPEFVRVVLGEKWQAAILPLQLMSLIVPLRLISIVLMTSVAAVGRADLCMKNMLVGVVLFPASFLIGVHWGIEGVAVAWPIAWALNLSFNLHRMANAVGMRVADVAQALRLPCMAGLAMLGSITAARFLLGDISDAVRLALLIGLGALAYLTALTALRPSIWQELRAVVATVRG